MFFLAEFYLPAAAVLAEVVERARAGAAVVALAGSQIRFVQAIFVAPDETCFALFEAADAETVSAAGAAAGLDFDRVTSAVVAL